MIDLPVISDCHDCGACCRTMSSPPGYAVITIRGPDQWPDEEDVARCLALTGEAKRTLDEYCAWLVASRPKGERPCIWFDPATRACRHYDDRPNICRDFAMGSDGCRNWRREFNVFPY